MREWRNGVRGWCTLGAVATLRPNVRGSVVSRASRRPCQARLASAIFFTVVKRSAAGQTFCYLVFSCRRPWE